MHRKLGLVGIIAIGCLSAYPAMTGCSTTANNNDGGTGTSDGGTADSGPVVIHDGGTDAGHVADAGPDKSVGAKCSTTVATSCKTGLTCEPFSDQNMCSALCTTDATCGTGNTCWSGVCWRGCDAAANPCPRADFSCQGLSATSSICLPDCTKEHASFCADFFGYPFATCDTANLGACNSDVNGTQCGTGAASPTCATGECFPIPGATTATSVCVPDCSIASTTACTTANAGTTCASGVCTSNVCATCPAGLACDTAATKTCLAVPEPYYGICSATVQCPTTPLANTCLHFPNATDGVCLSACTGDADCTGLSPSSKCLIQLTSGSSVCAEPCSTTATDGGPPVTVCPTGTTCKAFQAPIGSICAP